MARMRIDRATARLLCLVLLILGAPAHAQTIFACGPEWGALTRALLPQARVFVATHALQDPHHIEARPSLIAHMRAENQ